MILHILVLLVLDEHCTGVGGSGECEVLLVQATSHAGQSLGTHAGAPDGTETDLMLEQWRTCQAH